MKKNLKSCTVIANLGREEVDYLDRVGKDALFSTGTKLSRNKVISAMILAIKQLGIDGEGTATKGALQKKIARAIGLKMHPETASKPIPIDGDSQKRLAA